MNINKTKQALTREILEELRLTKDLTQQQIADLMGVTRSYYGQVACGAVPISRKFAKKALEAFPELANLSTYEQPLNIVDSTVGSVVNGSNNNVQTPPTPTQDETQDLSIVPTEVLEDHLEVVQENNEMLQKIREDQERELRMKKEQGRQLSEVLDFIQGLDKVMQTRVRDIIEDRTRAIIANTNHHIHSQALVMLTAIEGIINMIEADVLNKDVFLKQLTAVRTQLRELANYKQ